MIFVGAIIIIFGSFFVNTTLKTFIPAAQEPSTTAQPYPVTSVSSQLPACADVCDLDELDNGTRREGTFGAIYWWNVKLGMALAFALSGHLLNFTGFNVALEGSQSAHTLLWMRVFDIGVPILTSLIAVAAVFTYNITEERAHQIRLELEKRRGKAV